MTPDTRALFSFMLAASYRRWCFILARLPPRVDCFGMKIASRNRAIIRVLP
jgi:hypothetical protein